MAAHGPDDSRATASHHLASDGEVRRFTTAFGQNGEAEVDRSLTNPSMSLDSVGNSPLITAARTNLSVAGEVAVSACARRSPQSLHPLPVPRGNVPASPGNSCQTNPSAITPITANKKNDAVIPMPLTSYGKNSATNPLVDQPKTTDTPIANPRMPAEISLPATPTRRCSQQRRAHPR